MCHVLNSHLQGLIFCFFKIIGAYLCTYFVLFLSSNNVNIFFFVPMVCTCIYFLSIFSRFFFLLGPPTGEIEENVHNFVHTWA